MLMFPGLDDAVLWASHFCPLRCGAQILGKNYERHINDECPQRQALCPEGCGEQILGSLLARHRAECPMNLLLTRAETAIRESSMREYRLAVDGAYEERERARARIVARGEEDPGPRGWPSQRSRIRIEKLEAGSRQLVQRSRRRAMEHLTAAIASAGADPNQAPAATGGVNALRYWDAFNNTDQHVKTGSRPWDLESPALPELLDALDEAAIAGVDVDLRRRGEVMLVSLLRRMVDGALGAVEDRHHALTDALERVRNSLRYFELEDPGDLVGIVQEARTESHKASLQVLSTSAPEFHQAIADGDVELCSWLLDKDRANPSLPDPRTGLPPIVVAAKAGDLPMCHMLLDWHAEVDAYCVADRCSPLHWASHHRSYRIMALLLGARANPRLQDKRGQDALMKLVRRDMPGPAPGCAWTWEVRHGRRLPGSPLPSSGVMDVESAKLLAEADPDCLGFCLQMSSACSGEARWPISMCGAQSAASTPGVRGRPLGTEGQAETEAETEEDMEDEALWTSYLRVAADPVHDVRAILAAAADACATDSSGLTALHHHLRSSPSRGDAGVVAALLKGSADVNVRDHAEHSTTPLLLAVSAKRADLVRLMITEAFPPADVDARAADGTSALALADAVGAREVAKLLREAGASAWQDVEVRLGARTTFSFDTRAPPVLG